MFADNEPPSHSKCLICDEDLNSSTLHILECGHSFCQSCLKEYLELRITEGKVLSVPCAVHTCRKGISDTVLSELISPELYSKYCYFKDRNRLMSNPHLRWCPRPDCQGYDLGGRNKLQLACNVCKYEYCYYCSEAWHGRKKCKRSNERKLDDWAANKNVKFCPNCKFRVEKNLGCDHMSCSQCSHEWCWLCGWDYNPSHHTECPVMKQRFSNPPLLLVLSLLLAPVLSPFTPFVLYLLINIFDPVEDELIAQFGNRWIGKLIRTRWLLFYPLFILSSPIISAAGLTLLVFAGGYATLLNCNDCCRHPFRNWVKGLFFIGLGAILGPVLLAGVVVAYALFSVVGLLLLLMKLAIVLVRLFNPGFMKPKLAPGYDDNLEVFDLDDKEVDLLSFEPSPSLSKLSVNPDQIQHFEEFMDEVSKPPAKCWELGYYQPFFDIETETVLTRLKRAIVPKSDFFEGGSPDLYSPFWIVTTLIFIIGVSSNADLLTRNDQWAPQISIVFSAASFLYCLTAAVPLGYFFLLQYAGQKSEFVPMLSLYAYSFLLYIPTLILCIIDYFLLRLAVLAATTCWAVSFLLCNQWSDLQHLPTNIKWVGVGLLAGGHFLFALVCLFCFLATA